MCHNLQRGEAQESKNHSASEERPGKHRPAGEQASHRLSVRIALFIAGKWRGIIWSEMKSILTGLADTSNSGCCLLD